MDRASVPEAPIQKDCYFRPHQGYIHRSSGGAGNWVEESEADTSPVQEGPYGNFSAIVLPFGVPHSRRSGAAANSVHEPTTATASSAHTEDDINFNAVRIAAWPMIGGTASPITFPRVLLFGMPPSGYSKWNESGNP